MLVWIQPNSNDFELELIKTFFFDYLSGNTISDRLENYLRLYID